MIIYNSRQFNTSLALTRKLGHALNNPKLISCNEGHSLTPTENGKGHILKRPYYCQTRICPACNYVKSVIDKTRASHVISEVCRENKNIIFYSLTLTIPNCSIYKLKDTIKYLSESFSRFKGYKMFRETILGYLCKVDIKRNLSDDTFHPHLHILVAVNGDMSNYPKVFSTENIYKRWIKATKSEEYLQINIQKIVNMTLMKKHMFNANRIPLMEEGNLDCQNVSQLEKLIKNSTNYILKEDNIIIDINNIYEQNEKELFDEFQLQIKGLRQIRSSGILKLPQQKKK